MRTFAEYVEKRDEEDVLNEFVPLLAAAPYAGAALGAAGSYLGGQAIGSALDASGITGVAKNVGSAVGQGANYLGKGVYNMGKGLYNAAFGSGKQAAPQQGQQGQQAAPQQNQQSQQAAQAQAQARQGGQGGFSRRTMGSQGDFATNHAQLTRSLQGYANIVKSNPALADDSEVQDALQDIAQNLNAIAQRANEKQQSRQAGAADYNRLGQYGDQRQPPQGNPYARGMRPLPANAPA